MIFYFYNFYIFKIYHLQKSIKVMSYVLNHIFCISKLNAYSIYPYQILHKSLINLLYIFNYDEKI